MTGEWTKEDDLQDHSSTNCETVGFLVYGVNKKTTMYVVASTRSKGEKGMEYNAITKIPKAWVKTIKEFS